MKCPYCNNEAERGTATLTSLQGFSSMLLSYLKEGEADKIFGSNSKDKIVLFGDNAPAFYCPLCNKVFAEFDVG